MRMIAQIKDVNQMKFLSFILAAVMSISVFVGGIFRNSNRNSAQDTAENVTDWEEGGLFEVLIDGEW